MVNISTGFNVLVGWHEEATYNEGMNVGTSMTAAGEINRMGIVTDFTLSPAVARYHSYGVGSQTRTNDPILEKNYDWSLTAVWQTSQADDTIYQFVEHVITNYTTALWDSFCFRIQSVPGGGATTEYLYLEGVVVTNISFKLSVGDVVTVTCNGFAAAVYNDNWVVTVFPTATSMPAAVATDPSPWHLGDVGTWGTIVDVSGEIQEFTIDWNLNCPKIPDFDSGGENSMSGPGALEVSWSGTYYGNDTTMGVDAVFSDMFAGVADLVISLDGVSTITFADASIDDMSFPFKEKELIIMNFSGKANSMTLA